MIIFGFDTATINWYLVLYVVCSLVFLFYGTNSVYSTGQIRGVMFGIGSALVLIYFGLRWFASPDDSTASEWPPVINMCPDYLTYIPNVGGSPACVDMLGVSTRGSTNSGTTTPTLQKVRPSDIPNLTRTVDKVFLYTSSDIKAANTANDKEKITTICNACQGAGITWEGVYDGDTCVALNRFKTAQAAIQQCLISI
jgi:hypothetical protein